MNMAMNPTQTRASAGTLAKPAPGSIIFDKVSVVFETAKLTAVSEFSLNIAPGEFVSIVGPSGCGKTTLLNFADFPALCYPNGGGGVFRGIGQELTVGVRPVPVAVVQIDSIKSDDAYFFIGHVRLLLK
jgi:ABC transporter